MFVETVNDITPEISLTVSGGCEAEPVGDAFVNGLHDGRRKKRDRERSVQESKRVVELQFVLPGHDSVIVLFRDRLLSQWRRSVTAGSGSHITIVFSAYQHGE